MYLTMKCDSAAGGASQQTGDSGYISTFSQARTTPAANQRPAAAPASQSQPGPALGRPRPAAATNRRPAPAPASQSQPPPRPRPPAPTNHGRVPEGGGGTVCECGTPAVLLTVRKEGPNTGRQFYKCDAAAGGRGCNFFLWADEGPARPPQRPAGPAQNGAGAGAGAGSSQGDATCNCGIPPRRYVERDGTLTAGVMVSLCRADPLVLLCRAHALTVLVIMSGVKILLVCRLGLYRNR